MNAHIQSFAEELATYVLVKADAAQLPVDLEKVAYSLGVSEIQKKDLAAEGYVEAIADGGYRVVLRAGRSPQRTRFSLAHEIGHVLIHKMEAAPKAPLGRRYRSFSRVGNQIDDETVADTLAGALLIPASTISRMLPGKFSMKGISRIAEVTESSTPTAMLRAMWYATQPCVAFHLRWTVDKPNTLRCMWTRSSRSVRPLTPDKIGELVEPSVMTHIRNVPNVQKFATILNRSGCVCRIEFTRVRYFERESFYGLAFLRGDWEAELFPAPEEVDFEPIPTAELEV